METNLRMTDVLPQRRGERRENRRRGSVDARASCGAASSAPTIVKLHVAMWRGALSYFFQEGGYGVGGELGGVEGCGG